MLHHSQKRENIKTTILAVTLTSKSGCTLRQLNNDYYELEGENIPWRELGHVSLLDFLKSMPETVQIKNINNTIIVKGIASDKSKHVSNLVAGQKAQKSVFVRKPVARICIPPHVINRIISLVNDHPGGVDKYCIFDKIKASIPFSNLSIEDVEKQLLITRKVTIRKNMIYPIQSKIKNFDNFKTTDDMPSSKPNFISQYEPKLIVTVAGDENSDMSDYNEDVFDFASFDEVSRHCRNSIETAKNTPTFIKETITKCQDEVTKHEPIIQDTQSNSYKSFNCNDSVENQMEFNNNKREDVKNYSHKENVEILINERVKFRLEKLIQNHPDGIWCANLPDQYLEEYKVSLNYVELGFNSVREFASQLPEIFHCIQPHDNIGDFKLYYAKREVPLNQTEKKQKAINLNQLHHTYEINDEEALPVTVSLDTCKKLIPDEVMTMGECVGYLNVADLVEIQEHIEVVVIEVFTPTFFWIQLRKKLKTFKKFMDDLHNFYAMNYESFIIPPVVLEKGLNCACIYNGIWHRAIIKTVKPDFQVVVLFYDYGTLKTYSPEAVYYLHRKFSYLPAQAIPCGLINVRPYKGSKWSRNATHLFAVQTSQIPLIATVASINTEDNSMMVTLTNTLGEDDVHINDWLVEEKLAEHGKMVYKVDMNNLLIYVEENLIFLPERCYEEETIMSDCNKDSSEEAIDVPLISPQSTLMDDKLFKPSFEFMSCNKQKEFPPKEEIPDQIFQNDSVPTTFTVTKNNANPFLQDEPVHNQIKGNRNSQKFMQLWTENLMLQMQITSALNLLLKSILLHNKEQTPITIDSINTNINTRGETVPSTLNTYSGKNTGINKDFANVECPTKHFAFTPTNQQAQTTTSYNRSYDLSSYTDLLQNTNIQSAIKKISEINSNSIMSTNSVFDMASQCLEDQKAPVVSSIPPGYEKFVKSSKSDQQNYFANNSTDLLIPTENSTNNNMPLKETNPFRLSLAGKLQIPDYQEEDYLCTNSKPVIEHDFINFESNDFNAKCTNYNILDDGKDTSFNHYQCFGTESSNNINTVQNNPFVLNYNWNIDDVTNRMSKINIGGQLKQYNVHKADIEKDCFSPSTKCPTKTSSCEVMNGNFTFASNYDTHNFSSSTLLPSTYSSETSAFTDNANINERHLTHLNTSVYSKDHELQTVWKDTNIPEYLFSNYTIFFQSFELPNGIAHVFHYQGEGWLLADEFVKIFTEFEITLQMKNVLHILGVCADFKDIDRSKYLIKFFKSNSILPKATQDVINDTRKLRLISLKSAIQRLHILDIISQKNVTGDFIHEKFTNGSISHKIWVNIRMILIH
ncbi:Tudor domain-containing protein 5 [Habropoda laboriosa]|uniref:Tudor domain-containing protein 5 n=1 Tax=Habropoda laboriosa TaxID=597456 RepID=A0A0L7R519_9HYME|nr:Tudor domain-containing protein 5 [Habropoda laboriosa]